MTTPSFLREAGYTHKDKLVLLTAHIMETTDAARVADALDMATASVRASLKKGGSIEEVAPSERDALVAAIIEACDLDRRSMRSKDWKHLMSVAADLVEVGATPDEVKARARNLRVKLRMPVTPGSLDKYWPSLADGRRFAPGQVYA